jgi:hypothetical protein
VDAEARAGDGPGQPLPTTAALRSAIFVERLPGHPRVSPDAMPTGLQNGG